MAESLTKAGRYQILEELGRGSMGVVYKGYDPVIGRTVAIKTMRIEGLAEGFEEFAARFKSEARAAGILSHPNIVTIYDFGEDNGLLYLAMEVLSGKSLQEVLKEEHVLPIERVISIYEQVSRALDHAHRRNVVHRDIKPANIMILDDGVVKVADFGIAKVLGSATGMTHTGLIVGTPNYMSPEQVRGQTIDGRSDIFALGVILYEMLAGQKPFAGQNITTVIYKIINENPAPPPIQTGPILHPGLWQVISKALAKRPEDRYQSCTDLFQDLKNYQSLGQTEQVLTATMVVPQTVPLSRTQPLPETPPLPPPPAGAAGPLPPSARASYAGPAQLPRPTETGAPRTAAPQFIPKPKRSPLLPVAGAILVIALLAAGGYFFLYHKATVRPGPATPPPASAPIPASSTVTAPSGGGPAATEEPRAATATSTGQETPTIEPTPSSNAPASDVTAIPPPAANAKPESTQTAQSAGSLTKGSTGKGTKAADASAATQPAGRETKAAQSPPRTQPAGLGSPVEAKPAKKNTPIPSPASPPARAQNAPSSPPLVERPQIQTTAAASAPVPPAPTTRPVTSSEGTSQFLLETEPTGLEAVIDGKSYGKTPIVAKLALGQHTLVLKSMGVQVLKRTFQQGIDDQYKKWVLPVTKPVS